MSDFFDMLWLYLKLLLLSPIFIIVVSIAGLIIGLIFSGVFNALGYIFAKLDAICAKNMILQKIWNMIISIVAIVTVLGIAIVIIGINVRSCSVDRSDSHLEWYRR